jgi:hypothetical protein
MVGSGRVGRVGWTSPSAPQLQHPVLAVQLQGPIDAIVTDDPQHGLTASYAFNDPERFQLRTYKGRLVQGKDPADQRAIAERIGRMDLDVLAAQEVEDIDTLRFFNTQQLAGRYPHLVLIEEATTPT